MLYIDPIAIESLCVKGMIRNFLELLKYKAEWYGRTIVSWEILKSF